MLAWIDATRAADTSSGLVTGTRSGSSEKPDRRTASVISSVSRISSSAFCCSAWASLISASAASCSARPKASSASRISRLLSPSRRSLIRSNACTLGPTACSAIAVPSLAAASSTLSTCAACRASVPKMPKDASVWSTLVSIPRDAFSSKRATPSISARVAASTASSVASTSRPSMVAATKSKTAASFAVIGLPFLSSTGAPFWA